MKLTFASACWKATGKAPSTVAEYALVAVGAVTRSAASSRSCVLWSAGRVSATLTPEAKSAAANACVPNTAAA